MERARLREKNDDGGANADPDRMGAAPSDIFAEAAPAGALPVLNDRVSVIFDAAAARPFREDGAGAPTVATVIDLCSFAIGGPLSCTKHLLSSA
jgi:hypothetical protein